MPGQRRAPVPVDTALCRRCQVQDPAITVRTEPLCTECFGKYVSTKIIKRMERFRVRHAEAGQERLLLLPLSRGPCSTVLLHTLSAHLRSQAEKSGRTGYRLHVLHIVDDENRLEGNTAVFDKVRARYPEHAYSTSPLSDVLALEGVQDLLTAEQSNVDAESGTGGDAKLSTIFASLSSATSRADLHQILLRRLALNTAQQHACEALIWGDSTTRLAERTLAETAKGRGFALPSLIGEHNDSSRGQEIKSHYPLRDLLRKELAAFASMQDPPLDELIVRNDGLKPAVSTRNTTIDDLMMQYFDSVEREYPSIVANVVRTTSKLQAIPLGEVEQMCELCEAPLLGQAPERSRLCYGCIRILPRAAG
ncbi:Cytoplasmic tRNA 2-thiolation protein 2 [Teratosphaeriaceae sp. CCFEE 6253]|nr:Cytoplasmic tRNA 2-thiolation protein 2 [Teratosphaeriaceae sp. CCFEE 6253]